MSWQDEFPGTKEPTTEDVVRLIDKYNRMEEFVEDKGSNSVRAYLQDYAHIKFIGFYLLQDLGINWFSEPESRGS